MAENSVFDRLISMLLLYAKGKAYTVEMKIKRIYEPPAKSDGKRILIDRLWPRGLTKEAAAIDLWLKEIAPSNELRRWYGHKAELWPEFQKRYFTELNRIPATVAQLRSEVSAGEVTLLFSAKDTERNNAQALVLYLQKQK